MLEIEQLEKKTRKERLLIEAVDLLRLVIIILILAYLIPSFIIRPETIVGESMEPTLHDEEKGVSNIFASLTFGIKRFDVVAIKVPESGDQWVKRVIGLPGETVSFKNGELYIDGTLMQQPFLEEQFELNGRIVSTHTSDFTYRVLADDEYFVMGDNRNNSLDSRMRGPFVRSDIIAKHFYVVSPLSQMRMVTNGN